jgi:hypothetical protein
VARLFARVDVLAMSTSNIKAHAWAARAPDPALAFAMVWPRDGSARDERREPGLQCAGQLL